MACSGTRYFIQDPKPLKTILSYVIHSLVSLIVSGSLVLGFPVGRSQLVWEGWAQCHSVFYPATTQSSISAVTGPRSLSIIQHLSLHISLISSLLESGHLLTSKVFPPGKIFFPDSLLISEILSFLHEHFFLILSFQQPKSRFSKSKQCVHRRTMSNQCPNWYFWLMLLYTLEDWSKHYQNLQPLHTKVQYLDIQYLLTVICHLSTHSLSYFFTYHAMRSLLPVRAPTPVSAGFPEDLYLIQGRPDGLFIISDVQNS